MQRHMRSFKLVWKTTARNGHVLMETLLPYTQDFYPALWQALREEVEPLDMHCRAPDFPKVSTAKVYFVGWGTGPGEPRELPEAVIHNAPGGVPAHSRSGISLVSIHTFTAVTRAMRALTNPLQISITSFMQER